MVDLGVEKGLLLAEDELRLWLSVGSVAVVIVDVDMR